MDSCGPSPDHVTYTAPPAVQGTLRNTGGMYLRSRRKEEGRKQL